MSTLWNVGLVFANAVRLTSHLKAARSEMEALRGQKSLRFFDLPPASAESATVMSPTAGSPTTRSEDIEPISPSLETPKMEENTSSFGGYNCTITVGSELIYFFKH